MNAWLQALVVVACLVVGVLGGLPFTRGVLGLAARSGDAGRVEAHDAGGDGPTGAGARSALRGGTWIGLLERAAVTGLVLLGYPSGIAFVIAVKGLGRYPELREHPGASERFVIGSLASLIWAVGVGLVGLALLP